MKKTLIFAAAAAMFIFASCQKEEFLREQNSQSDELVFTAAINPSSTKTTINTDGSDETDRGKIEWVEGDEITITDANNTSVVYVAETGGSSVSFKKKAGETKSLASGSTYRAAYKAAPVTMQAYGDYYSAVNQAKNLYMTAPPTSGTTLTFTAACGLLKLNLTAGGASVKDISRIEIVGTPTGGPTSVYTLACDNESITSAKDFYIALPAGSYNLMKFTNSKGSVCFKKVTTAMVIESNKIQPATLSGITFSALLPGKFTVASGKQVQFTAANLYWDGSDYAFELAQAEYPTAWNTSHTAWDTSHVGHFLWTETAANSYAESCSESWRLDSAKFFADGSDADHLLTVDGQSGLYVLTGGNSGEWKYLFDSRTSGLYKGGVTITTGGGKEYTNCLIIAPDGYSGQIESSYDAAAWIAAESDGLVCLTSAGFRSAYAVGFGILYGIYWSATPAFEESEGLERKAYCLHFIDDTSLDPAFDSSICNPAGDYSILDIGYSIRLVSNPPTTGTAKAKIGGVKVDVNWVQLWKDGPKFSVKNVGAVTYTDKGSAMTYNEAVQTGSAYVWGGNWKTPSKYEMDLLNTSKVSRSYCNEGGVYGFKFTGVQDGYTDNSLFLPTGMEGTSYWSSDEEYTGYGWALNLSFNIFNNEWQAIKNSVDSYVRPVLNE